MLTHMNLDLKRAYGERYIKDGGLAFMYTDPTYDVVQRVRIMWTELGD